LSEGVCECLQKLFAIRAFADTASLESDLIDVFVDIFLELRNAGEVYLLIRDILLARTSTNVAAGTVTIKLNVDLPAELVGKVFDFLGSSGESVGNSRGSALGLSEEAVELPARGIEGALLVFPAVMDQRPAVLMDHVADKMYRRSLS